MGSTPTGSAHNMPTPHVYADRDNHHHGTRPPPTASRHRLGIPSPDQSAPRYSAIPLAQPPPPTLICPCKFDRHYQTGQTVWF
jgi:hypothetical protein